jgi:restriction endonuclease S subunit
MVKLREFIHLIDRTEKVMPDKMYRQVGVRVWGKGAYERESIQGCNTKYTELSKVQSNDIIVNKIWARNGSIAIIAKELDGCYCSSEFPLFVIDENKACLGWVKWLIKTPWFWKQCMEKSGGTSGKNRITPNNFLDINIELPPLDKQIETFRRLDNTAPFIFQLGLINKETSIFIQDLRQSILQTAISGKLVPQDIDDEPAGKLLKKIEAEKEKLFGEKRPLSKKDMPQITEEEIPYEIPKGWAWVRLNQICTQITDGTHITPTYLNEGIPFLSVKDISNGEIDLSRCKYVSKEEYVRLTRGCKPEYLDILLTKVGTTGIAKTIDIKKEFCIFVSLAILKFPKKYIYPYYLENLLNSPLLKRQSKEGTEGIGNKNLVLRKIAKFIVPLPPFNEQIRIVEKINQLMKLCKNLELKGKENQIYSENLMKAVLKEAFSKDLLLAS